ncbi:hypothetical protein A1O7_05148 [Cladophialophora yegresii CBS 114405]|uniref:Transcription factor domain-containing protein n=1 Tax=Cladophialophora yegresii CBS 114405 TaxID=1182544 RepID=W9W7M8_9EURO|nr:uncharacterized protein A1O7_05148 [Cladophialophora yegresii CBS 114405]EXJ60995.1 hypothetical protein A1O7_05148 [Cladophialophora yegresii CBS 114405]
MNHNKNPPPLMFIVGDGKNPQKSTRAIKSAKTSHISSRYRYWSKANHRDLALDSTTKAILNGASSYLNKLSTGNYRKKPPEQLNGEQADDDRRAREQSGLLDCKTTVITPESPQPHVAVKPWEQARKDYEQWATCPLSILGSQFFDIFTPSVAMKYDIEVKTNLYFYFKIIRPFATHLLQPWQWFDNLGQIQASPCLTYAVATFASVFLSGMLRGGRGVVLPPETEKGQNCPWTIPPWLRLHTKCLSELNAILSDPAQVIDESCYQAILFLYRLSVLLADGETGRMHLQALKRMALLLDMDQSSLGRELAVSKINIIGAFLHSKSVVLVRKVKDKANEPEKEVVEIDRKFWRSDREWYSHRAGLAGRTLAWRPESPSSSLLPESAAAIARMDPDSKLLGEAEHLEIQRCYQIALFFWKYLNCISFNTSALIIRSNLLELQYRMSNMDLPTMSLICYTTLFNILLAGSEAARSKPERAWFVQRIVWLYPDIQHLDTVWQLLAEFFDPLALNFKFVEEIWEDVVAVRGCGTEKSINSEDKRLVKPIKHFRPTSYAPDLTKPLPVFELRDVEEATLEKGIHKAPGCATDAT